MDKQGDSSPDPQLDDFRARRNYLPEDAFALVTGVYEGATDLIPEDQWHELMSFPTDVLLRTSDQCGTQLAQLNRLWGRWVETLPLEADVAPFMFNVGLDAGDDFNAATFNTAHGYYRQGMANLRSAMNGLTIAASFAVRRNEAGLRRWLSGESEPPKFGNARDILTTPLGADATNVLNELQAKLSGYVHSQASATNAMLWGASNGPVFERSSFRHVYGYFRDVMAMGFVLLSIGWPEFSIVDDLWPLFERPNGTWANVSLPDFKRQLMGDSVG